MRLRTTRSTILALALAPMLAAAPPARAAEYVVRLAPSAPAPSAAAPRDRARLGAIGLTPIRRLDDGLGPSRARPAREGLAARSPFDLDPARTWLVLASETQAAAAGADPAIEWIEPNQLRDFAAWPGPGQPDDPLFRDTRQWGLWNAGPSGNFHGTLGADVQALAAWQMCVGANDVRLAVADTGIDPTHPELAATMPDGGPRIVDGLNVTLDPTPGFVDSTWHGTSVAGVFGARTNDGVHVDSMGVAGLCGGDGASNFGCRIVPIRITIGRATDATSFDIARAIVYSADVGAVAMNLSYAGIGPSRVEREAMYYALTRGCVVVASAGNSGFSTPTQAQYPAAYAVDGLCIQVGATDEKDLRTVWSSYGPGLDLVAPGVNIWTTFLTYPSWTGLQRNGYVPAAGTSFSAPFVTGAVGLLAAARPELTDTDFQRVIRESAHDVGAPGVDQQTGWGRLDAAAALRAVPPTFGVWHDEIAAGAVRSIRTDSLIVGESGPGIMTPPRTWPSAELLEVTATVAIPDSFVDSIRVWPRVGGTMSVRGDFRLPYFAPWCEVSDRTARTFTLRGYFYRVPPTCAGCTEPEELPLPLDQARFGFTVIGKVNRTPASVPPPAAPSAFRVAPNPMRSQARFEIPAAGRVAILDASGRRLREVVLDAGGTWDWDGLDSNGRAAPPGLYFARLQSAAGDHTVRFVRLGK